MFLPDLLTRELSEFNGPWFRLDDISVPISQGLLALNVIYARGEVATRFGHSTELTPNDAISALFNWLYSYLGQNVNTLVWYKPATGVKRAILPGGSTATLMVETTAKGAVFVNAGSRLYAAFYDQFGVGTAPGQVYGIAPAAADQLFAGPITATPTITEPGGVGLVTAGLHRFGYLLQTRNGYTTQWCPVNNLTQFTPLSFTASGLKQLQVSFVGTAWPTYASNVQLIMTTAANLNRYFLVPGCSSPVPGGSTFSISLPTVSISDDDLAGGVDAVAYQNLLTADVNGIAPFRPASIFPYSSRLGYATVDGAGFPVVYFSDPDNYQQITANQHGVYLPGNLIVNTGRALRGVAYLFGPHWTYSTSDTGGTPTTWAKPQLVDGSIGTLSPNGVADNPAQGFLWVADESGLYLFEGGQYPSRPISYYQQPDWDRINWGGAPTAVKVIDNKSKKRVEVQAPLDGSLIPNARLVWDYTEGVDPETAKYSLLTMPGYAQGSITVVQNATSGKLETWLAPSVAGAVLSENDGVEALPYRDVATDGTTPVAIGALYETALLPGLDAQRGQIHFFHGNHFRVRGGGNMALEIFTLDHLRSVVPKQSPIPLSIKPGKELLVRYFLSGECVSVQVASSDLDAFFLLSGIKQYYTPQGPIR